MASSTKPLLTAVGALLDSIILSCRRVGQTRDEKLTLADIRTQADVGVSGGRTINGGPATTDALSLGSGGVVALKVASVAAGASFVTITADVTDGFPSITAADAGATCSLLLASKGNRAVTLKTNSINRWNFKGNGNIEDASGNGGTAAVNWGISSATAPSFSFVSDNTTGVGRAGAGKLSLTCTANEILRAEFSGGAPKLGVLGKIGSPAPAQTGGAQTATSLYTATEQAMLQAAYDCLRTFGFLT
jgi:hypothetical protein